MKCEQRVAVRVTPRSSEDIILGYDEATGVLRINVKAAPVDNAANEATIKLLSKNLKIPQRKMRIARGAKSRDKIVVFEADQSLIAKIKVL